MFDCIIPGTALPIVHLTNNANASFLPHAYLHKPNDKKLNVQSEVQRLGLYSRI